MILITRGIVKNKINFSFYLLSLALLFTGMKMALLFFIFLTLFFIFKRGNLRLNLLTFVTLVTGLLFIKPIVGLVSRVIPFWNILFNEHGFITVLTSKRDLLFQDAIQYLYKEGSVLNFLFGGLRYPNYRVEVDFVDLFLFLGILGGGIYIWIIRKKIQGGIYIVPLLTGMFTGWFIVGAITMIVYLIWNYESFIEDKEKC
jgi:hypothetical protein